MPFAPLFDEIAESQIVEKIMVVVERDMKAALDHFYAADNLPAFAVMTEGDQDVFSYPLLTLVVQEGASDETVSGEYLDQQIRVGAALAVSGSTIKDVRRKAKKYVRAFKAVVRKGVLELLPAASDYLDYSISFRWRYLRHGTSGTTFTQAVEILIQIKFGET